MSGNGEAWREEGGSAGQYGALSVRPPSSFCAPHNPYLGWEVVHLPDGLPVGGEDAWDDEWGPHLQAPEGDAGHEAPGSSGGLDILSVRAARAEQGQAARPAVVEAAAKSGLPEVHLVVLRSGVDNGGHVCLV